MVKWSKIRKIRSEDFDEVFDTILREIEDEHNMELLRRHMRNTMDLMRDVIDSVDFSNVSSIDQAFSNFDSRIDILNKKLK